MTSPVPRSAGLLRLPVATPDRPLQLRSGAVLDDVVLEVRTWGEPAPDRSNAVLVCHSFSADAHAAGVDPDAAPSHRPWRQGNVGWWDPLIGPGKVLDTDRLWVVCSSVLGGCGGSTGPCCPAADGEPWGERFPEIAIADLVACQVRLADLLGVARWRAVLGGSLGGLQTLEWAFSHPERLERWCAIAAAPRASLAGMRHFAAGIDYILRERDAGGSGHRALLHAFGTGRHFSGPADRLPDDRSWTANWPEERFHPVSYLRLARALLAFDVALDHGDGDLVAACRRLEAPGWLLPFREDELFPPSEADRLRAAARGAGREVALEVLSGPAGHDSFLVEPLCVAQALASLEL